jgi:hypothetical protein
MTNMTDMIEASRKVWDTAPSPMRTAMVDAAMRLVADVGPTNSTALGMVEGIVAGRGVEEEVATLTVVCLLALAHGWSVE